MLTDSLNLEADFIGKYRPDQYQAICNGKSHNQDRDIP